MTEATFFYLWEQGIVKAAKDVVAEIIQDLQEKYKNYKVTLNTTTEMRDKLYQEYHKFRKKIRQQYFDTGKNDENLMDGHKICACITGSLLSVHLVSFDKKLKDIPEEIFYSNYAIAFLSGIYIQYLFLLSDYKRDGDLESFNELKKQATFYFPETNPGHDSYICGRIKTLALNDINGNDFDVLTYADMLFWIEKYNKDLINKKRKNWGLPQCRSFNNN
jgi:hypothetical protein